MLWTTADTNLRCAFVENVLVFIDPEIGGARGPHMLSLSSPSVYEQPLRGLCSLTDWDVTARSLFWQVSMYLYKPSDRSSSEPVDFWYMPSASSQQQQRRHHQSQPSGQYAGHHQVWPVATLYISPATVSFHVSICEKAREPKTSSWWRKFAYRIRGRLISNGFLTIFIQSEHKNGDSIWVIPCAPPARIPHSRRAPPAPSTTAWGWSAGWNPQTSALGRW